MAAEATQKCVKCSNFQNELLNGLSFILNLQNTKALIFRRFLRTVTKVPIRLYNLM